MYIYLYVQRKIFSLFSDLLDDLWVNVVLIVALEGVQELEVTEELLRRSPEVFHHFPTTGGIWLPLWLNPLHDAHRLHHQLHQSWGVLGRNQ